MKWRKFSPIKPSGRLTDVVPFNSDQNLKAKCAKIRSNPCASRLVFLDPAGAAKYNTRPGANLLYCLGEKTPGPVVPVSSADDATKKGKDFCVCAKKKGATKCVPPKKAGAGAALNGYKKSKRLRTNRYGLYGYGKR